MKKQIRDKIYDTLQELCDRVKNDYGVDMLVGVGLKDEDELIEGGMCSEGMDYPTACKLLVGINSYISDHFGSPEGCRHCKHD